jgi:hypothetical protein
MWRVCVVSRSEGPRMLAKRRSLRLDGGEVQRTPLLVPSFSSKGFPDVSKIIKTMEEVIEGTILVSAYDLHHKKISPPFDFPSLIFLDSGGYEASKSAELSDFGESDHRPQEWTQDMHEAVLAGWKPPVPTVLISYDHPKERLPVLEQIHRAKRMAPDRVGILREILLKPETKDQMLLNVDSVLPHIHALADFDAIGVTEKEIGNSIFGRMENIAKLRMALGKVGLETPIHVFGSLDTIATPMYFLAGADIFDGLTWLRFAFHDGYTMYKHNYGALDLGIKATMHIIDGRTWFHNYRYLVDLELEMRRFLKDYDFACFKHHSDLFRDAHESMVEAVGGLDGRKW